MAKKKKAMRRKPKRHEHDDSAPASTDPSTTTDDEVVGEGDGDDQPDEPKASSTKSHKPKRDDVDDQEDDDDAEDAEDDAKAALDGDDDDTADAKSDKASPFPEGAAWGRPFAKVESGWTWIEVRILFVVLIFLLLALTAWVALKGLSSPLATENASGTVFRALFGALVLGFLSRLATRGMRDQPQKRNAITTVVVVIAVIVAPWWREVGVEYSGRILNWLQEGSSLTLFGGLRGVGTRLTILLALVGASIAAGSGKHINIDVILRFMRPGLRKVVHVLGAIATASVCFAGSWGFFDYISINGFKADPDVSRSEKAGQVYDQLGQQWFIWRKQVGLDFDAAPDVLSGTKWDDEGRMNGAQWNAWIEESGYRDYFEKEEVDGLLAPETMLDQPRIAQALMPGHNTRGLLIHGLDLFYAIGLFLIGVRVLLRALLVVAGHRTVEPDPEDIETQHEVGGDGEDASKKDDADESDDEPEKDEEDDADESDDDAKAAADAGSDESDADPSEDAPDEPDEDDADESDDDAQDEEPAASKETKDGRKVKRSGSTKGRKEGSE